MRYYIGIDGGGTKTALCAVCAENPALLYSKTSGSSWRDHGIPEVAQNLKKAVDELMGNDCEKVAGIAMGLPCCGESAEGDRLLKQTVEDTFAPVPVYLANDAEAGWAGSTALSPGINIVSGTGSIAFGKDEHGNTARSGGWSEFFGDEGSGYWVGRRLMEVFSKQSDGRMPRDQLYDTVRREFSLHDDFAFIDIVHGEYVASRKKVARLQLVAEKAALAGSPSAKKIYEDAVCELLLLVNAVRSRLDFTGKPWAVSYSGGLFKAGELVLPHFSREIEKTGGKLLPPRFGPAEGAALLAFQHFCPGSLEQAKKIFENENNTGGKT